MTNELMVGDWVICHHPTCEPKQIQVTVGLLNVLERQDLGFQTEESPLYRIVEPIPLTAEILEKNGFKNYRLSYGNDGYYYHIVLEDVKGGMWIDVMSSRNVLHGRKEYCGLINYVHELQHAIRLCGIDKSIEL